MTAPCNPVESPVHYLGLLSPFGPLTLFQEDNHLVALEWGAAPSGAEETPLLIEARDQLNAYFDGALRRFDLPLRPDGTPYRQSIWKALSAIPFGETRTYGDLVKDAGGAPRSVGGACGANPIPIIIPCHRVVGANGTLTGFSGGAGVATKQALLDLEHAALSAA